MAVPTNFVGLALFVVFITPGYLWVRIEERSRPRPDRSPLLELAELLMVGAVASLVAAVLVAELGSRVKSLLDVGDWIGASDRGGVLRAHLAPAMNSLLLAVLIAHGATHSVATWWFSQSGTAQRVRFHRWLRRQVRMKPPAPPRIQAAHTPWFDVFGSVDKTKELAVLTVVQEDGEVLTGLLRSYDVTAPAGGQDLALQAPLTYQRPGEQARPALAHYAMIPGGVIKRVFVEVKPRPTEPASDERGD